MKAFGSSCDLSTGRNFAEASPHLGQAKMMVWQSFQNTGILVIGILGSTHMRPRKALLKSALGPQGFGLSSPFLASG